MKLIYVLAIVFLLIPATGCSKDAVHLELHVIDGDGAPVVSAEVRIGFLHGQRGSSFRGLTDEDGFIEATKDAVYGMKIRILKEGYYDSRYRTGRGDQDLTMILRRKKNPIGMYAKKTRLDAPSEPGSEEPAYNVWIGYDFKKGDYVEPYGDGAVKDFEIRMNLAEQDFWNYRADWEIRFPNEGDGLFPFNIEHRASLLKSDYMAPDSGYEREWKFYNYSEGVGTPIVTNLDVSRNYYFRVRTVLDNEGTVIFANYGKVYGEFFYDLNYYFNPEVNDRNVEFDFHKNLFKKN